MNSLFYRRHLPSLARWKWLVPAAILAGCGRNEVQVYRVAKEQPEAQAQMQQGQAGKDRPAAVNAPPTLKWVLPEGWQEVAPGEMRVASFHVQSKDARQADVSVVPLPGLMGRDLENVNRWRSTVGLPAVTEEELPKLAQTVQIAGLPAQLYDQGGENPGSGEKSRILVAILRREGTAWFFKMNGDDALVAEQKPAFVEFLKSLSFETASAQAGLPPSHPPIGDGAVMSAPNAPASGATGAKPDWQVPAGWKETTAGQFLVAKFLVVGADNAQAAINVSMSSGDGGGLLSNVNRWRGQLGLAPVSEDEMKKLLTSLPPPNDKTLLVTMTGTDARTGQKTRLVGAIVPQSSQTWFYKLMGNEQVVEEQKEVFTKFVKTAKY